MNALSRLVVVNSQRVLKKVGLQHRMHSIFLIHLLPWPVCAYTMNHYIIVSLYSTPTTRKRL